jgi:glycosyltransferase involved in cell wall biosynthesis
VPLDDSADFAQKLCALIDDPALRAEMGRKAVTAIKPYSVSSVMDEMAGIYGRMI